MITVDFSLLPVRPGDRVLDLGCGGGRHAFEAYRRGAHVVAFDQDENELAGVAGMFAAMRAEGEAPAAEAETVKGDALDMPFDDAAFDRVIAAEIFEHIPHDTRAMAELYRVLRPGGLAAVTVPSWLPERLCWALSEEYHTNEGGHIRIYTRAELEAKLRSTGFEVGPHHHAHALHSPYWWLKCAVGPGDDEHPLVRGYHRMLVWDMLQAPRITRTAERLLNPLIGKSVVVYLRRPHHGVRPGDGV
ncbi:class I SAM-dependent methyltransferase [Marinitenerispora sediminis]|uniref:Methyltransferase n=1 Tax=Marinitenerispora sediminis TaxID=1931232 RepID=A0A368T7Z7_9ACTN|nr:class I SAM-dependent methyltransferase [Marinitenerispora sediminis]RCV51134.1 methyltransferase [Marinitenerispora sediminis]RCV58349.1 methyltransferase [Marinitenerispora sediminis]RCV60153.1 methyltransferase [Marinitenerispora sediminis]